MAEGGFDCGGNMSGSDSESEAEDDRMAREMREGLLMLSLDGEDEGRESKTEASAAEKSEQGVSTDANLCDSSLVGSNADSTDTQYSRRRRSRAGSFSFGRLVRRLSSRRSGNSTDGNTNSGRARTRRRSRAESEEDGATDSLHYNTTQVRSRPRSVALQPRSQTEAESMDRARRRRSVSLFERLRKMFDSGNADTVESETGNEFEALPGSAAILSMADSRSFGSSMWDANDPIRFPIGVNELVAIRRERARLRAEQTRIEYYIIRDLQEITNCPWYWGKINRFEAERVLDGHPDGTFLLRDSAQYHYLFSVSFRRYFRTYHARIEQWKHRYSFDKPSDYSYCSSTVSELLEHYSQAEQCMYYEPLLLNSLPRKNALLLQHMCRAVVCNNVTFQGIDELPIPKSLKLFLREYHYKVAVKIMADKCTQTTAPKRKFLSRS